MAGIGFELRRLLRRESVLDYVRAYGYAGLISSGPWLLSLVTVLTIAGLCARVVQPHALVIQFLLSVTYLMAGSLLLTSPLQLLFSRFVADRVFEDRQEAVLPNVVGALLLTTLVAGVIGASVMWGLFPDAPTYQILMLGTFVTLSDCWIVVVLLGGLKAYRRVLAAFTIGNLVSAVAAVTLRRWGIEGLLFGFWAGQAAMTFGLLAVVITESPTSEFISFDFLRRTQSFYSLALVGVLYNIGIWVDKALFWSNPVTSEPVLGPLRSSMIYDLPIFLAHLSIVPGMAVFLLRIETDFAEAYQSFFSAIREGASLGEIEQLKSDMVESVRAGLFDIFKVQGLTVLALVLESESVLQLFGISPLYASLLRVDAVGVGIEVLMLAVLSVLFYLDKRVAALVVTGVFAVSNAALTRLSQQLGPEFFGYGFAVAALLAGVIGLGLLSRALDRLEFETFMSQG